MPFDILDHLLKYSDQDSLVAVAQTNSEFQALARRTFHTKQHNRIWLCPDTDLDVIRTFGEQATRLSINEYVGCYFTDAESVQLCQQLEKYCPNITSLKIPIDNEKIASSQFVRKIMKRVKSLKLVLTCRAESNPHAVREALANAESLEYLKMEFCCKTIECPQIIYGHKFPKLHTLKLNDKSKHGAGFQPKFLIDICPNLKHLELNGKIGLNHLAAIKELKSLEYLSLHCTNNRFKNGLVTELEKFPMLKALDVSIQTIQVNMNEIFALPSVTSLALTIKASPINLDIFMDWLRLHEKNLQNLVQITLPKFRDYDKTILLQDYLAQYPKLKSTIWNFC